MSWNIQKQRQYIQCVPNSHPYARIAIMKLLYDADLTGKIGEAPQFLIEDALAEAYRAGAIDAIFGETE